MTRTVIRHPVRWFLGVTVILFSGCASLTPGPPSEATLQSWQRHVQAVRAQTDWTLAARIIANTEDDGWSGKLDWHQESTAFQLHFAAPFGQGAMQLDGEPSRVEMRTSDGQILVDRDAESLLFQQLGWRLPLNSLRYWVRGVPVPERKGEMAPVLAFDASGRLASLQQSQWQVEYPAYRQVGGLMLPRKVYLENGELSVRLVIDRWGPGDAGDH